jgi:hypothetical protein
LGKINRRRTCSVILSLQYFKNAVFHVEAFAVRCKEINRSNRPPNEQQSSSFAENASSKTGCVKHAAHQLFYASLSLIFFQLWNMSRLIFKEDVYLKSSFHGL